MISRINKSPGVFVIFFLLATLLPGCKPQKASMDNEFSNNLPMAEVFFAVTLPTPMVEGEDLYLSVLDEVTGLAFNTTELKMQKGDDTHFYIALAFPLNSIVKYKYLKKGQSSIYEIQPDGSSIRYRMYYIGGPGEVMDLVANWSDTVYSGTTGRMTGRVVDGASGVGIADILICSGGNQVLTDSSGEFIIEGLSEGIQNLVAISLDGSFQPFQQGARIAAGKRTPVNLALNRATMVNVSFLVSVPANTLPSIPIRFAGNLIQLGNSFADLRGGINGVATKMPVLSPTLDGKYSISLLLPVGADIRYKYSLGDGLWNAELDEDGKFVTRQLIVPPAGGLIENVVETWQADQTSPVLIEVISPSNTPADDTISIQFNPFNWMEPLPMWSLGNNRWVYQLYGPFNLMKEFGYRYCRNQQCGAADDSYSPINPLERSIKGTRNEQNIKDVITSWKWMSTSETIYPQDYPIVSRSSSFWTGVEFQADGYHPSWEARITQSLQEVKSIGSNTIIFSPTWSFTKIDPLKFSPEPGTDQLGVDTAKNINLAKETNLNIALYPQANFPLPAGNWWQATPRYGAWWDNWFNQYRSFALYFADLAATNGVGTLILGGDWLNPALPGGTLADYSDSNPPADAEMRWSSLISEVRQHFSGQILWALPYKGSFENIPGLIYEVDGIYVLWYASLTETENDSIEKMNQIAGNRLDNDIWLLFATYEKQIILSVAYPSIRDSEFACLPDGVNGCQEWKTLNQPSQMSDPPQVVLQAQFNSYQALMQAVNEREWINGFISRGFYPPAKLSDASASIHGKPSQELLKQWFSIWSGSDQ